MDRPEERARGRVLSRLRGLRRPGFVAAVTYAFASMALYPGIWRNPATVTTCTCGDHALFMFWLGWMEWAVRHGHGIFFTEHLSVPNGVNALWNTSIPLPAFLMMPVTAIFGPVASLNVLVAAGPALSALTMYLALRRWARPLPAFCGGLFYGFSPFVMGHIVGHLHLTLVMIPPLLLMLADEIVVRQRRSPVKMGALFGLALFAQLMIGEEILATGALAGAVGLAVVAVQHRSLVRSHWRYAARAFGVAMAVFGVLAVGPVVHQFAGPQHIRGPVQSAATYGIDAMNPIVPTHRMWLHTEGTIELTRNFPGNYAERTGYLGIPVVIAGAVALVRRRRDPVAWFAATSAVPMLILSFGRTFVVNGHDTGIPLPVRLLDKVPPFDSVISTRFSMLTTFFLAIVVARLLDDLPGWRPFTSVRPVFVTVAAALLLLVPVAPDAPFGALRSSVPAYFTSDEVKRIPEGSVALVAPWPNAQDARPMAWQAAAGLRFKMPGGYAIQPWADGRAHFSPEGTATSGTLARIRLGRLGAPIPDDRRLAVLADLEKWQVRTVLVGPMDHANRAIAIFTEMFGRPPVVSGGVAAWYDVDPAAAARLPGG